MTNTNIDFILEGINKYLLALAKEQIRLAFEQAEKEVEDLHQRTKEGIETAKLAGKQIGKSKGDTWETKKSKEVKQIILKHSKDFNGTLADVGFRSAVCVLPIAMLHRLGFDGGGLVFIPKHRKYHIANISSDT